jgi:hypothetical protein
VVDRDRFGELVAAYLVTHGPSLATDLRRGLPPALVAGTDRSSFLQLLDSLQPQVVRVPPGWRYRFRGAAELQREHAVRARHLALAPRMREAFGTPQRAAVEVFTWLLPGRGAISTADARLGQAIHASLGDLAWAAHRILRRPPDLIPADPRGAWLDHLLHRREVYFHAPEPSVVEMRVRLARTLPPCELTEDLESPGPPTTWAWGVRLSALFDPAFGAALVEGGDHPALGAWTASYPTRKDPGYFRVGSGAYGGHGSGGGGGSTYGRRYPGSRLPAGRVRRR